MSESGCGETSGLQRERSQTKKVQVTVMLKQSHKRWSVLAICLSVAVAPSILARQSSDEAEIQRLLTHFDDLMRGDSSQGTLAMTIKTKRFERSLEMQTWSKGTDKSLVRVLQPVKEKGTATLRVGDKIWNYLPKVDRTIKVPSSMMGASWMGSHFTNDDLVAEIRYSEDFDCGFSTTSSAQSEASDEQGAQTLHIDCIPNEDVAVVWGKVSMVLDKSSELPTKTLFYDEDGELVRTMLYENVRTFGTRRIPTTLTAIPADEEGEFTRVEHSQLEFDIELPDRLFSMQSLKQ